MRGVGTAFRRRRSKTNYGDTGMDTNQFILTHADTVHLCRKNSCPFVFSGG